MQKCENWLINCQFFLSMVTFHRFNSNFFLQTSVIKKISFTKRLDSVTNFVGLITYRDRTFGKKFESDFFK